jgi:hypothetical protein
MRAVWQAPFVIGGAVLAVAIAYVSTFDLTKPPTDLPVPLGIAIGAGIAAIGVLLMLRWSQQMVLFAFLAVAQIIALKVGDTTVQLAVIVLVPLAARVLLFTSREVRPAWGWPEWTAISWIALQFISTFLYAEDLTTSIGTAGLLAIGVLTYLVTFTGVCTRERLILAVRAVLAAAVVSAVIGLLSLVAYFVFGVTIGMATLPGVGPVVRGIAREPDLLGSTCGAAAITFLVLAREDNPVIKRVWALLAFWTCVGGMAVTLTRGALIAFSVALLAALTLRRRTPTQRIRLIKVLAPLTGALVLSVGALVVVGSQGTNGPVAQISEQGAIKIEGLTQASGSVRQRAGESLIALNDLRLSPIFGLGSGSFGERHIDYTLDPPGPGYLGNLYLRTLYDTGAVGLVLLVVFLVGVLWPRPTLRRSRAELAPVAWALIFGSGTLAIAYGVTDGSLLVWPWILLGLVRASSTLTLIEHGALASTARTGRAALEHPEPVGAPGA